MLFVVFLAEAPLFVLTQSKANSPKHVHQQKTLPYNQTLVLTASVGPTVEGLTMLEPADRPNPPESPQRPGVFLAPASSAVNQIANLLEPPSSSLQGSSKSLAAVFVSCLTQ